MVIERTVSNEKKNTSATNVKCKPLFGCFLLLVFVRERSGWGRLVPFSTYYILGREDKRTNNRTMFPTLKTNSCRLSGSSENRA